MKTAAIYARVSSDRQKEEQTISSQTSALRAYAAEHGYLVPDGWVYEDEGWSGATLVRPGLERVRDLAAQGQVDSLLVYSPDRLSRKYAYQVLLLEEFARAGVDVVFVRAPRVETPEEVLLVQFLDVAIDQPQLPFLGQQGGDGAEAERGGRVVRIHKTAGIPVVPE